MALGQVADPPPDGRHHHGELRTIGVDVGPEQLVRGVVHIVAQRLGESLVGERDALVVMAVEDTGPELFDPPSQRGDERALADPRLPADEDHLPALPGLDPLVRLDQRVVRLVPSEHSTDVGEGRQARGKRGVQINGVLRRRLGQGLPGDLHRVDGLGQTLELELTDQAEHVRVPTARHELDELRREDLATLGTRAKPGRLYDRIAKEVVYLAGHLSAADADSETQLVVAAAVVELHGLLHGHCTCEGRRGGREGDHDAVPEVLDLGSPVADDGLSEGREVCPADLVRRVRRERVGQLRGANQVREQDRHALSYRHGSSSGAHRPSWEGT